MRFYAPRRSRFLTGALILALLVAMPLVFGLIRPPAGHEPSPLPGVVGVYAHGFSSLGLAGLIALPLGALFALWLILGERKAVNRRVLAQSHRRRANGLEAARTLGTIFGAAGLIVGSLAGLYALMREYAAHAMIEPYLPLTFELAIPCLVLGGLAYTLARIGR